MLQTNTKTRTMATDNRPILIQSLLDVHTPERCVRAGKIYCIMATMGEIDNCVRNRTMAVMMRVKCGL